MTTPANIAETFAVLTPELNVQTVEPDEPGSYVVVPRNTWHTARVSSRVRMLFMTPGEGTENRPEP